MEEVTATATAIFNTGIFIPLGENVNIYNLDEVITKDGFGKTKNFQYTLTSGIRGVEVLGNRMSVDSSTSGEITIQVLEPEKGTNANAVTTPYVPYTAVFNTSIETPAPAPVPFQIPNSYDLDIVITKYGFGRTEMFTYELLNKTTGISVTDNILSVDESAYGEIVIQVTGGGIAFQKGTPAETGGGIMQANATTKLYGFNSTMLELFNNETTLIAFQNAIASTKNDWPNLVSDDRKAIDNGGGIDNGGVTPLPS
jgi:hypothetical protein